MKLKLQLIMLPLFTLLDSLLYTHTNGDVKLLLLTQLEMPLFSNLLGLSVLSPFLPLSLLEILLL